ncbi:type IV secretory system conjugative DNA transfer family protein [Actinomyces oris]|uniref:type IV secretory system conjugative DNA transfer family protein n=1 Tax=Actinomyces oris TaxID=544580 RepID=UPI00142F2F8F|nr:FtsK/SpoIIIE domain-containing protein [Actinomyces oris]
MAIATTVTTTLTALSVWGFIAAERNRWSFALVAVAIVIACAFASWLAWHRVPIRTTLRPSEMPWSSRAAIFAYWRRDDVDRVLRNLRELRWISACSAAGLERRVRHHALVGDDIIEDLYVPEVTAIRRVPRGLEVTIRSLPSMSPAETAKAAERLGSALGASVTAEPSPDDAAGVVLTVVVGPDPLAKVREYPVADAASAPVGSALVGITVTGKQWMIPIIGGHTLVVGMTGAGKGSVLGGIAVGMTPQIQARSIKMYGIDLKGGVEQEAYKQIFEKRARTYAEAADLLAEINALLDDRLELMRCDGVRDAELCPAYPGIVVMIDEAAMLTYAADSTKEEKSVDKNLRAILTRGRAASISVVSALQDPRKDALRARDLFTSRIIMASSGVADSLMVVNREQWEMGTRPEELYGMPGSAYATTMVARDGKLTTPKNPQRVRAFLVDDATLNGLPPAPGVRSDDENPALVVD